MAGTLATALVTIVRDEVQKRHETRKRRADKFEELVAAVYEYDHWTEQRRWQHFDKDLPPQTVSPFAKVQSISSIYFPQFSKLVISLDAASSLYIAWMSQTKTEGISKDTQTILSSYNEVYKSYAEKREALLDALSGFAREHFQ